MAKGFNTLNIYPETADLIRAISKLERRPIVCVVEEAMLKYTEHLTPVEVSV